MVSKADLSDSPSPFYTVALAVPSAATAAARAVSDNAISAAGDAVAALEGAFAEALTAEADAWMLVATDATALERGSSHAAAGARPLDGGLLVATRYWRLLRQKLLDAKEGWQVWTDWYDAVLEGRALDPDLELKKALIPDEIWKQSPAVVNAEIARLIAEHHAARPQGETLAYNPASNRVGTVPAPVDHDEALANAVSQVEDALDDFRNSGVGNRAYILNPVVRRLERMLENYRDNPRRVHDDLMRASRDIARAIDQDPEIDEIPTRDLRDVCGQGAIDVRIAVKAVSEMEADRRRRTARQPSAHAQSAAQHLLAEIGEGLDPDLREEMLEDVETVAASGAGEGHELPDSAARDAMLRISARLGWIHQFARTSEDRIIALAQMTGRAVKDIEGLIALFRAAEKWWDVIEWLLKVT